MGCEEKYDKAMEKIDVCCFTTIDTECSRTKKKIPMNSGCLCRDRQKKSLRQWDTRMSAIEVCLRFTDGATFGMTERKGKCRRRRHTSEHYRKWQTRSPDYDASRPNRWLPLTDIQRTRGSPVKHQKGRCPLLSSLSPLQIIKQSWKLLADNISELFF